MLSARDCAIAIYNNHFIFTITIHTEMVGCTDSQLHLLAGPLDAVPLQPPAMWQGGAQRTAPTAQQGRQTSLRPC